MLGSVPVVMIMNFFGEVLHPDVNSKEHIYQPVQSFYYSQALGSTVHSEGGFIFQDVFMAMKIGCKQKALVSMQSLQKHKA